MRYDIEKRVFMTKKLLSLGSSTLVQRAWRTQFKNVKPPSHTTITRVATRFESRGSVIDKPPFHTKPSEKREEAKNQLKSLYSENPSLSIRKAACAVGISCSMTRDILLNDLKLKPYKYNDCHELLDGDDQRRMDFASWLSNLPANAHKWFIFSDESYFYLTESINKQNNRMWLESRPIDWIERPLNDEKVLVWCAISATKIYGPYFFEETVNQYNYLDMLKNFFWPKHLRTKDYKKYYFQQDGATAHTANSVQDWLSSKFSDRFLDKNRWPARSPDLNPCDYFLWGYLKSKVYNPLPKNLDDLKANIEREVKNIKSDILASTILNFKKRCLLITKTDGGHIENQ